jgi:hypothetical protein
MVDFRDFAFKIIGNRFEPMKEAHVVAYGEKGQ